mgnify:FL=1
MIFEYLVLMVSSALGNCPAFQCGSFDSNYCARWNGTTIELNSQGCKSYKQSCTFSKALVSYYFNSDSGNYLCENSAQFSYSEGYMNCGTRQNTKTKLVEGEHPKKCLEPGYSDFNCELLDGSFLECKCGLDSEYYCTPNPSSNIFDEFWQACEDQDNVVTAQFYEYYELLSKFYIEYNTAPDCALTLFQEFSLLQGSEPDSESATIASFALLYLML